MSREFRLGLFIFITMSILAAGIFMIGDKEFLFSSTYRLNTYFQNVAGLNDGAVVRVGGIQKGTVKHLELPKRPDEKVTVAMDLESGTRRIIKKDSVASIKSEGLLGDKYVEISFGSGAAESVKDGDTIGSEPPLEISELMKKTNGILETTDQAVQNVAAITSKLNQGQGTMGALINDKSMYQHANAAAAQAKAGATAFSEDMEALKHNFLLRGFFKNRGYEDSSELKKYEIARLPPEASIKKFSFEANKIFDQADTAKLKSHKVLDEAGKYLEGSNFGLVVVASYTGMKGDAEKARVLTEARTLVVRNYLAQNFKLDDTRIRTLGWGETKDPGEAGKVEIIVYPDGAKPLTENRGGR